MATMFQHRVSETSSISCRHLSILNWSGMSEYGTPYLENRLGAAVLTVTYTLIVVTIMLAIARFYASLRWKYKVGFDVLAPPTRKCRSFCLFNVGQ